MRTSCLQAAEYWVMEATYTWPLSRARVDQWPEPWTFFDWKTMPSGKVWHSSKECEVVDPWYARWILQAGPWNLILLFHLRDRNFKSRFLNHGVLACVVACLILWKASNKPKATLESSQASQWCWVHFVSRWPAQCKPGCQHLRPSRTWFDMPCCITMVGFTWMLTL